MLIRDTQDDNAYLYCIIMEFHINTFSMDLKLNYLKTTHFIQNLSLKGDIKNA